MNGTKPLQRAKADVKKAEDALTSAQKTHASWLAFEAQARELAETADQCDRKLLVLRAVRARKETEDRRAKLVRARVLDSAYPDGQPALAPDDAALADEVAGALSLWSTRLGVPLLAGPSAADIRAEIEKLPPMPPGDRIPRLNVIATMRTYERAVQAVELHQKEQPPAAPVPDTKEFTADQLRELARALETTVPSVDDGLEIAYREAQHRLNKIRTSRLQRPLIGGFALAGLVGGLGVWAAWNHWIGVALVLLGIVALVQLAVRADEKGREQAMGALLKSEAQLVAQK